MKALISPLEPVENFDGTTGYRVAEVEPDYKVFEVAKPFFWADCPDECSADIWYYDPADKFCKKKPAPDPDNITPVEVLP
jgi:hypothetical protein